jgi:hypothetical protein
VEYCAVPSYHAQVAEVVPVIGGYPVCTGIGGGTNVSKTGDPSALTVFILVLATRMSITRIISAYQNPGRVVFIIYPPLEGLFEVTPF